MLDFLIIGTSYKKGIVEIYPHFIVRKSSDLMIRGGKFYAIWNQEKGLWSTDPDEAVNLIDYELEKYAEENKSKYENIKILYMWDSDSGQIDKFKKYCEKQANDHYHALDEQLIFANTPTKKEDYASKRLPYPLQEGPTPAFDHLLYTLYSEEEAHKIMWCIGSIVSGDSKHIQKFAVLYGAAGTGKSTILNIIQDLFVGYRAVFNAKALGSSSSTFALESFKSNPLVAIQHDGDLSRIEDNTRLNSLVSHELMTVNEKFKSEYENKFNAFLFMGTNKPVQITDSKSGLLRRLIDISPTGLKLAPEDYKNTMHQIKFELGAIAYKCLQLYLEDPEYYNDYMPLDMMEASNDFYNFVSHYYTEWKKEDGVFLSAAWDLYNKYCEFANITNRIKYGPFKEELKNYFWNYSGRVTLEDGSRPRHYYSGFRTDRFELKKPSKKKKSKDEKKEYDFPKFNTRSSLFDIQFANCSAQYSKPDGSPQKFWDNVHTTLSDLDTSSLHYVLVPLSHIVIDFDIPGDDGEKSLEKNLEAASKFPPTYAELSKSGKGIHLHYNYTGGDPDKLSRLYADHIEIKVFNGNSSLRRKVSWCNDLPIADISSGLPLRGEETRRMLNQDSIKHETELRRRIEKCLRMEYPKMQSHTENINFIYDILEDCYASGMTYDVNNLRTPIMEFAKKSRHQAANCVRKVLKMKFASEKEPEQVPPKSEEIVFFDVEVFPNLLLVCFKHAGEGHPVVRMINPTPEQIDDLLQHRLIGFNCRRYDNHIIWARRLGHTVSQIYGLSDNIINGSGSTNPFFRDAYDLSYTDVFDFCSKKQSLKKWEIELGINHHELGLRWDKPVPEELWTTVAEYCDDDVLATEAVFNQRQADFEARCGLADITDSKVNDTTNTLTTKLIFGKNRNPQNEFCYRNLAEPVKELPEEQMKFLTNAFPEMMDYWKDKESILPYFPGYVYKFGKSTYKGFDVGEGGFVWSKPGMYDDTTTFDIISMHPHSLEAECHFGPNYTKKFYDLVQTRVHIKHKEFDEASKLFDGKMAKYLTDPDQAKSLSNALKIAINSVYGLTSAKFDNPFHDPRNVDNIVAKRGSLFMIDLKEAVEAIGGNVIHIKTDSIKVVKPSKEVVELIHEMGKRYGYSFEIEHHFEKICLVNDAVYIGKCADDDPEEPGEWTATGTQFAVPYVFKTLFSKEPIEFKDLCETKSVQSALYLDMNEDLPDVSLYEMVRDLRNSSKRTKKEEAILEQYSSISDEELHKLIDKGHKYVFVGKVGQFTPIKKGCGGGTLLRLAGYYPDGSEKYASATGASGYKWLESSVVKEMNKENDIDKSYYETLVNEAIDNLSQYGDIEGFRA